MSERHERGGGAMLLEPPPEDKPEHSVEEFEDTFHFEPGDAFVTGEKHTWREIVAVDREAHAVQFERTDNDGNIHVDDPLFSFDDLIKNRRAIQEIHRTELPRGVTQEDLNAQDWVPLQRIAAQLKEIKQKRFDNPSADKEKEEMLLRGRAEVFARIKRKLSL